MKFLNSALHVARLEAALFRNFPKLRFSVVGIVLIPALYSFIYLTSVWDPANRTSQLPAAIVNLDRGVEMQGKQVNLGAELATSLKGKHAFGFADSSDAELAKREVREGKILFALIVPPEFSANAMARQQQARASSWSTPRKAITMRALASPGALRPSWATNSMKP